jgi:hypothetical protein
MEPRVAIHVEDADVGVPADHAPQVQPLSGPLKPLGFVPLGAWSIVPAAVNEREVAADLLEAGPSPRDLLADKGFNGAAFAAQQAARGTAVLVPPTRDQRKRMPPILQKIIAEWRNRVEASFGEITDLMELARHGAHSFWGRSPVPLRPSPLTPCCGSAWPGSSRRRSTHITRLRPAASSLTTSRPTKELAGSAASAPAVANRAALPKRQYVCVGLSPPSLRDSRTPLRSGPRSRNTREAVLAALQHHHASRRPSTPVTATIHVAGAWRPSALSPKRPRNSAAVMSASRIRAINSACSCISASFAVS